MDARVSLPADKVEKGLQVVEEISRGQAPRSAESIGHEYEQAVYQQFGIIHPEQMLMTFRCVWEDLDMQLLPLTKEAERQALQEFRNHYWKQDCPCLCTRIAICSCGTRF